jgi:hypothetical protein
MWTRRVASTPMGGKIGEKSMPVSPSLHEMRISLVELSVVKKARTLRIQETVTSVPKPNRKRRRRSDAMVCAAPSSVP